MSIRSLSGPEFSLLAPELVDIYIAAMHYDPEIRSQRIAVWRQEIIWPGFTAVIAVEHDGNREKLLGLAYGFIGSRERWWDKQLLRGLKENGGVTAFHQEILNSYFEIAEIHVTPRIQNRGIGHALLEALLDRAPAHWALLSTPEVPHEANSAFGLYRKIGFQDILRNFIYSGDPRPFAVLGRPLPLTPAR